MKPDPEPTLSRRAFLSALWGGWIALALALMQQLRVPTYTPSQRQVILGRPDEFAQGLTPLPLYQAWLVRTPEGFFALRSVCPHLGCPPEWKAQEQTFVCPCHGSRFSAEGRLRQGPALRALDRYQIYLTQAGLLALNLEQTYRAENGGWQLPKAFVSWKA